MGAHQLLPPPLDVDIDVDLEEEAELDEEGPDVLLVPPLGMDPPDPALSWNHGTVIRPPSEEVA